MNIFYLDEDVQKCAEYHVDRHVVKMILEYAQLLSTAHRVLDGDDKKVLPDYRENVLYRATHANHPSAKWARVNTGNYNWLYSLFLACLTEYTYRYGKVHKCFQGDLAYMLSSPPNNLRKNEWTKMPSAMAEEYKISDDPLTNYRNYYKVAKSRMHSWKNRQQPDWI